MKPAFTFAEVTAAPEDRQLIFQLWRKKARRSGFKDGYSLSALPASHFGRIFYGKPDSDDITPSSPTLWNTCGKPLVCDETYPSYGVHPIRRDQL